MRDSILAAFIPVGIFVLIAIMLFMPKSFLGSFGVWILAESYLGVAFLDGYYLSRKYKIDRRVLIFFAALLGVVIVVVSYVPVEVQILSYAITAAVSLIMYARIVVEFRRRKYA